ncbi:MAG: type II toxin-antitoxin system VapC family toxin [Myxococcota bacterium]
MSFWDSSALVPVLVDEPSSAAMRLRYAEDAGPAVWWGTSIECASALARLEREGALTANEIATSFGRLDELQAGWDVVEPSEDLREIARRFVRVHPLRAADALQLAAAYLASERRPPTLELVSLDDRLRDAALREGFAVLGA